MLLLRLLLITCSSCDVFFHAPNSPLSANNALLPSSLNLRCYKLNSHNFIQHFQKSLFSGFHGHKPQDGKPCTAEHTRENFFTYTSRTEATHSFFNILSAFCIRHSQTVVFLPSFMGLKFVTSGVRRCPVAFGYTEN